MNLRIRSLALILLVSFLSEQVSFAEGGLQFTRAQSQQDKSYTLQVPINDALGEVVDSKKFSSNKVVFLIQDAHTNESCQKNVAEILSGLIDHENVGSVYTEGGFGDVSLDFLRQQMSAVERQRVCESSLLKGTMDGAEHLSLCSDKKFRIYGVESPDLYWRTIDSYQDIVSSRASMQEFAGRAGIALKALEDQHYNPIMMLLIQKKAEYESNPSNFGSYLEFLTQQATQYGIDLSSYKHLKLALKLQKLEKSIDFNVLNKEHESALVWLRAHGHNEVVELAKQAAKDSSPAFASQSVRKGYFLHISSLLTDIESYPEFQKYIAYLHEAEAISTEGIFGEVRDVTDSLFAKLCDDPAKQLPIYEARQGLALLKSLYEFKLTSQEYETYKKKNVTIRSLSDFINTTLKNDAQNVDKAILVPAENLDRMTRAQDFYNLTYERDEYFVKTMLQQMTERGEKSAVFFGGGYHTPNLARLLGQQNISYVVIRPHVYTETNYQKYESLLLGQKQQLIHYAKNLGITPQGAVSMAKTGPALGNESWVATLPSQIQPLARNASLPTVRIALGISEQVVAPTLAGARFAADIDEAIFALHSWKTEANNPNDKWDEPSDNPFVTRLQARAIRISKEYHLERFSLMERLQFLAVMFADPMVQTHYKKEWDVINAMHRKFVSDSEMTHVQWTPQKYREAGSMFSEYERKLDTQTYHNIRVAFNILFDFFEDEVNIPEQEAIFENIQKELTNPGSGQLPETAAIQDIHGGSRRFLALLGFSMGLPADIYNRVQNLDELEGELLSHNINPEKLYLRIIGLADQYDRGPDPIGVADAVRWLHEKGLAKFFIGNHDFWRQTAVLGVHRFFTSDREAAGKQAVDLNSPANTQHHIGYWAQDAFAHAGWGDIELDLINQRRFNQVIARANQIIGIRNSSLKSGTQPIELLEPLDLASVRQAFDKELQAKKRKNKDIQTARRQTKAAWDLDPGNTALQDAYNQASAVQEEVLPDIFEQTLAHTRQKIQEANQAIARLNSADNTLNLPLIDFTVLDLTNYHLDPEVIERTLWELKNFRFFYVDILGNIHMHNILPYNAQSGGFIVNYGGKTGLDALELMAQRVREFFSSYDTIPDSPAFRKKMWDEIGDVFEIINTWYSDKEVHSKAENVVRFINEGGLETLGQGILGHSTQTFAPRVVDGFIVFGHNERKKFTDGKVNLPWVYPYLSNGTAIVNIDFEISPGYSDRGAIATFFKRDQNGRVTGFRLWGFDDDSGEIHDLTMTDSNKMTEDQRLFLAKLSDGVQYMKWYRKEAIKSLLVQIDRLIASASTSNRPDKVQQLEAKKKELETKLRDYIREDVLARLRQRSIKVDSLEFDDKTLELLDTVENTRPTLWAQALSAITQQSESGNLSRHVVATMDSDKLLIYSHAKGTTRAPENRRVHFNEHQIAGARFAAHSPKQVQEYQVYTIGEGDNLFEVSTFGANVISLKLGGQEMLWHGTNGQTLRQDGKKLAVAGGMPFMFPWTSRIEDGLLEVNGRKFSLYDADLVRRARNAQTGAEHPLHGILDKVVWNVDSHSDTNITLSVKMSDVILEGAYELAGEQKIPVTKLSEIFGDARVVLTYTLSEGNLKSQIEIEAITDTVFSFGHHPFIQLDGELSDWTVTIPANKYLKVDAGQVPLKEDAVNVDGATDFRNRRAVEKAELLLTALMPDGNGRIEVVFQHKSGRQVIFSGSALTYQNLTYWVPFDNPAFPKNTVSIQFTTSSPNAVNDPDRGHLVSLKKGETYLAGWSVSAQSGESVSTGARMAADNAFMNSLKPNLSGANLQKAVSLRQTTLEPFQYDAAVTGARMVQQMDRRLWLQTAAAGLATLSLPSVIPAQNQLNPAQEAIDASVSENIGALVQHLLNNVTADGMPLSYYLPEGYYNTVDYTVDGIDTTDSIESILERLLTAYSLNVYDGAVTQIAWAMSDESSAIDRYAKILASNRTRGVNSIKASTAKGPDDEIMFEYNGKRLTAAQAWYFRAIAESYQMQDPLDETNSLKAKTDKDGKARPGTFPNADEFHMEDYKPIAGENAWVMLGDIQTAKLQAGAKPVSYDSPLIAHALSLIDAFEIMQSPTGGIYHAPKGTYQKDPRDISTENNASAYAAFKTLLEVLEASRASVTSSAKRARLDAQVKQIKKILYGDKLTGRKGIEDYFREYAYDKESGIFYQGGFWIDGEFVPSKDFATDVQTWTVASLSPEWVVRNVGNGDPLVLVNLWKNTMVRTGYFKNNTLKGVGFTDGHDILSSEWTFGAILMVREMAVYFEELAKKDAANRQQYEDIAANFWADSRSMRQGVDEELKVTAEDGSISYKYANKRYYIVFGWWANPIPSNAGTGWAVMMDGPTERNYLNPFVLGGGKQYVKVAIRKPGDKSTEGPTEKKPDQIVSASGMYGANADESWRSWFIVNDQPIGALSAYKEAEIAIPVKAAQASFKVGILIKSTNGREYLKTITIPAAIARDGGVYTLRIPITDIVKALGATGNIKEFHVGEGVGFSGTTLNRNNDEKFDIGNKGAVKVPELRLFKKSAGARFAAQLTSKLKLFWGAVILAVLGFVGVIANWSINRGQEKAVTQNIESTVQIPSQTTKPLPLIAQSLPGSIIDNWSLDDHYEGANFAGHFIRYSPEDEDYNTLTGIAEIMKNQEAVLDVIIDPASKEALNNVSIFIKGAEDGALEITLRRQGEVYYVQEIYNYNWPDDQKFKYFEIGESPDFEISVTNQGSSFAVSLPINQLSKAISGPIKKIDVQHGAKVGESPQFPSNNGNNLDLKAHVLLRKPESAGARFAQAERAQDFQLFDGVNISEVGILTVGSGRFLLGLLKELRDAGYVRKAVVAQPRGEGSADELIASKGTYGFELRRFDGSIASSDVSGAVAAAGSLGSDASKQRYYDLAKTPELNLDAILVGVTEGGLDENSPSMLDLTHILVNYFKAHNGQSKPWLINTDNKAWNGDLILTIVKKLSDGLIDTDQKAQFESWLESVIANTKVDRIVVEQKDEAGKTTKASTVVTEELPSLLLSIAPIDEAAQVPAALEAVLAKTPFIQIRKAGDGVSARQKLAKDYALKLRVLNAIHTIMAHVSVLLDINVTRESIADARIASLIERIFENEILPTILQNEDLAGLVDEAYVRAYYQEWMQKRLANTGINQRNVFITANGLTKIEERLLPTVVDENQITDDMAFVIASILYQMTPRFHDIHYPKPGEAAVHRYFYSDHFDAQYQIKDKPQKLALVDKLWQARLLPDETLDGAIIDILAGLALADKKLSDVPGSDKIINFYKQLRSSNANAVLDTLSSVDGSRLGKIMLLRQYVNGPFLRGVGLNMIHLKNGGTIIVGQVKNVESAGNAMEVAGQLVPVERFPRSITIITADGSTPNLAPGQELTLQASEIATVEVHEEDASGARFAGLSRRDFLRGTAQLTGVAALLNAFPWLSFVPGYLRADEIEIDREVRTRWGSVDEPKTSTAVTITNATGDGKARFVSFAPGDAKSVNTIHKSSGIVPFIPAFATEADLNNIQNKKPDPAKYDGKAFLMLLAQIISMQEGIQLKTDLVDALDKYYGVNPDQYAKKIEELKKLPEQPRTPYSATWAEFRELSKVAQRKILYAIIDSETALQFTNDDASSFRNRATEAENANAKVIQIYIPGNLSREQIITARLMMDSVEKRHKGQVKFAIVLPAGIAGIPGAPSLKEVTEAKLKEHERYARDLVQWFGDHPSVLYWQVGVMSDIYTQGSGNYQYGPVNMTIEEWAKFVYRLGYAIKNQQGFLDLNEDGQPKAKSAYKRPTLLGVGGPYKEFFELLKRENARSQFDALALTMYPGYDFKPEGVERNDDMVALKNTLDLLGEYDWATTLQSGSFFKPDKLTHGQQWQRMSQTLKAHPQLGRILLGGYGVAGEFEAFLYKILDPDAFSGVARLGDRQKALKITKDRQRELAAQRAGFATDLDEPDLKSKDWPVRSEAATEIAALPNTTGGARFAVAWQDYKHLTTPVYGHSASGWTPDEQLDADDGITIARTAAMLYYFETMHDWTQPDAMDKAKALIFKRFKRSLLRTGSYEGGYYGHGGAYHRTNLGRYWGDGVHRFARQTKLPWISYEQISDSFHGAFVSDAHYIVISKPLPQLDGKIVVIDAHNYPYMGRGSESGEVFVQIMDRSELTNFIRSNVAQVVPGHAVSYEQIAARASHDDRGLNLRDYANHLIGPDFAELKKEFTLYSTEVSFAGDLRVPKRFQLRHYGPRRTDPRTRNAGAVRTVDFTLVHQGETAAAGLTTFTYSFTTDLGETGQTQLTVAADGKIVDFTHDKLGDNSWDHHYIFLDLLAMRNQELHLSEADFLKMGPGGARFATLKELKSKQDWTYEDLLQVIRLGRLKAVRRMSNSSKDANVTIYRIELPKQDEEVLVAVRLLNDSIVVAFYGMAPLKSRRALPVGPFMLHSAPVDAAVLVVNQEYSRAILNALERKRQPKPSRKGSKPFTIDFTRYFDWQFVIHDMGEVGAPIYFDRTYTNYSHSIDQMYMLHSHYPATWKKFLDYVRQQVQEHSIHQVVIDERVDYEALHQYFQGEQSNVSPEISSIRPGQLVFFGHSGARFAKDRSTTIDEVISSVGTAADVNASWTLIARFDGKQSSISYFGADRDSKLRGLLTTLLPEQGSYGTVNVDVKKTDHTIVVTIEKAIVEGARFAKDRATIIQDILKSVKREVGGSDSLRLTFHYQGQTQLFNYYHNQGEGPLTDSLQFFLPADASYGSSRLEPVSPGNEINIYIEPFIPDTQLFSLGADNSTIDAKVVVAEDIARQYPTFFAYEDDATPPANTVKVYSSSMLKTLTLSNGDKIFLIVTPAFDVHEGQHQTLVKAYRLKNDGAPKQSLESYELSHDLEFKSGVIGYNVNNAEVTGFKFGVYEHNGQVYLVFIRREGNSDSANLVLAGLSKDLGNRVVRAGFILTPEQLTDARRVLVDVISAPVSGGYIAGKFFINFDGGFSIDTDAGIISLKDYDQVLMLNLANGARFAQTQQKIVKFDTQSYSLPERVQTLHEIGGQDRAVVTILRNQADNQDFLEYSLELDNTTIGKAVVRQKHVLSQSGAFNLGDTIEAVPDTGTDVVDVEISLTQFSRVVRSLGVSSQDMQTANDNLQHHLKAFFAAHIKDQQRLHDTAREIYSDRFDLNPEDAPYALLVAHSLLSINPKLTQSAIEEVLNLSADLVFGSYAEADRLKLIAGITYELTQTQLEDTQVLQASVIVSTIRGIIESILASEGTDEELLTKADKRSAELEVLVSSVDGARLIVSTKRGSGVGAIQTDESRFLLLTVARENKTRLNAGEILPLEGQLLALRLTGDTLEVIDNLSGEVIDSISNASNTLRQLSEKFASKLPQQAVQANSARRIYNMGIRHAFSELPALSIDRAYYLDLSLLNNFDASNPSQVAQLRLHLEILLEDVKQILSMDKSARVVFNTSQASEIVRSLYNQLRWPQGVLEGNIDDAKGSGVAIAVIGSEQSVFEKDAQVVNVQANTGAIAPVNGPLNQALLTDFSWLRLFVNGYALAGSFEYTRQADTLSRVVDDKRLSSAVAYLSTSLDTKAAQMVKQDKYWLSKMADGVLSVEQRNLFAFVPVIQKVEFGVLMRLARSAAVSA